MRDHINQSPNQFWIPSVVPNQKFRLKLPIFIDFHSPDEFSTESFGIKLVQRNSMFLAPCHGDSGILWGAQTIAMSATLPRRMQEDGRSETYHVIDLWSCKRDLLAFLTIEGLEFLCGNTLVYLDDSFKDFSCCLCFSGFDTKREQKDSSVALLR